MKKNLLMFGLLTLSLTFNACGGEENEKTIPEGTSEVTIDEDKTEVTSSNVTNWTQYAVQVANLLTKDAIDLKNAWSEDYNGKGSYAETFKNPGTGKTFTSYASCAQQIVEGCADIASEVGTAKMGEPRDLWESGKYTEAVYAVESWYSFHSIEDYSNNILSIRNAIMGSRDGKQAANSIAAYLQKHNTTLYTSIVSKINTAYNSIQSITAPFRSHIGSSTVLAAMQACATLENALTNDLKPIVIAASEEDLKPIIETYVDDVVLPTYENLVTLNTRLNTAIRNLANYPSTSAFSAAATAWLNARAPWETSEAFLFGPVADLGLDPNMDSWPLDADALKNIIENGNFEDLEWTGEFDEKDETIAAAQNVRGFHTLEFLLFKNGKPRTYNK